MFEFPCVLSDLEDQENPAVPVKELLRINLFEKTINKLNLSQLIYCPEKNFFKPTYGPGSPFAPFGPGKPGIPGAPGDPARPESPRSPFLPIELTPPSPGGPGYPDRPD